jgi:hypothetical protein
MPESESNFADRDSRASEERAAARAKRQGLEHERDVLIATIDRQMRAMKGVSSGTRKNMELSSPTVTRGAAVS